jgi:cytochrome c oxidase subunit 1
MFTTMMVAVPSGVKMFNWLATMWGGSISLKTPMLFAIGFLFMFLIGGVDGVFNSVVPIDYAINDTYWVVSHIHYVLFGGSVFGIFAGIYYWFPKMTGRLLDEGLGKVHFWLMLIGMNLAFMPMHILGLKGMPRRIAEYQGGQGWEVWNLIATIGALTIGVSMLVFIFNVVKSWATAPQTAGDDPWEGNTLEWLTSSPPPVHNFHDLPEIRSERPALDQRLARSQVGLPAAH